MNLNGRRGRKVNATMFGSVSLSYHNNGGGAIKVLMHRARGIARARARDILERQVEDH